MTYTNPTKSIFRVDIDSSKVDTFKDLEKILHNLTDDLHSGPHDIHNDAGEVIGNYGFVRMLR